MDGKPIDQETEAFLKNLMYINVDECHRYTKGMDAKMFETIMDYLFQCQMKLVVGTSATAKDINKLWDWAGSTIDRAKFTFRPSQEDLKKDGLAQQPVEFLSVDNKTTIFDRQYTDSLGIDPDDDPNFKKYCDEILSADSQEAFDNLIDEDHKGKFRTDPQFAIEVVAYQMNRVDVAINHWLKKECGQPAIISVKGVANACLYEKKFKQVVKNAGYDIIAWNGETKRGQYAHADYKNDEKKMLADLRDPTHPLKVVLVNGMLREGTNEPIRVVYQCAFTPGGAETSLQVGNRGEYTVITLDAMNVSKFDQTGHLQALKDTLKDILDKTGQEHTDEELEKLAVALQSQQSRLNAINPEHKKPHVCDQLIEDWLNQPNDAGVTDDGTNWTQILSKDVWVKDVVYLGNYQTLTLEKTNIHQTLQHALDIAGEFRHAV